MTQVGQGIHLQSYYWGYHFKVFYHPYVCAFIKALNAGGIDGLLKWTAQNGGETSVQKLEDPYSPYSFYKQYQPTEYVLDYQTDTVDFSPDGAYSQYNWELFFHAPLLIATRLSANQRFAEAQKWFHYIFDPTDGSIQPGTQRFWKVKPFWSVAQYPAENELKDLLNPDPNDATAMQTAKNLAQDVEAWRLNPFEPHLVARQRQWAYPKAVVMKYLDNLIAWGDLLFRQNTLETINEATLLYILAADILGPRPVEIPPQVVPKATTYKDLRSKFKLEDFSDALVASENLAFPLNQGQNGQGNGHQQGLPDTLEFCIPKNDQLLGRWDAVADRLFKIRHCMNIEGVVQQLPLFEPPIDVGALVRAAAAGVDISSVLNDLYAPLPHYRFGTMLQKALEICADVKMLGSALLSALEKGDAEGLSLLRSGQEIDLLAAVRLVKEKQIDEAKDNWDALTKSKVVIQARYDYYNGLINQTALPGQLSALAEAKGISLPGGLSIWEVAHLELVGEGVILQASQAIGEFIAAILHLIPDTKIGAPTTDGVTLGGSNIASGIQSFASSQGIAASILNTIGSMAATVGGYQRRMEEWKHQLDLASKERDQVDAQIAAADVRWQIAQFELSNHDKQTDNAKAVDEFMRGKFTNQELFEWMLSQTSSIYFQTYQMAYDIAKRAEKCFQFERGDPQASFIKFGYWDSLKKGLLAGERLHYDLRRMELAYLDQNKREYEITKHISLIMLNPLAVIALKETGQCIVELPEALFDMDYPGHYMRRIKNVTLTIPCVTGPYTSVNCTLTLLKTSIRQENGTKGDDGNYARDVKSHDPRFVDSFGAVESIATSHAQNDGGMFELNFRDERYLPFEGYGVISQWHIEMPKENNAFDFETISDVILNLNYTAREGGDALRVAARNEVVSKPHKNLLRMFSLKHEFANEWYRFLHPADNALSQTMSLGLTMERFPFQFRGRTIQIIGVDLFLKFKDIHDPDTYQNGTPFGDYDGRALKVSLTAPGDNNGNPASLVSDSNFLNGAPHALIDFGNQPKVLGTWSLEVENADVDNIAPSLRNAAHHLKPDVIEDIYMVCHYSAS